MRIPLIALASAIALGLAGAGPAATAPGQVAAETFDPEILQEDLLLIPPAALAAPSPARVSAPTAAQATAAPARETTFGWRILLDQFLAAEDADRLRQEAILNLERTDVEVVFSAPWHRVEVGSFRTEPEAQESLTSIRYVYPDALKVRAQISVPGKP